MNIVIHDLRNEQFQSLFPKAGRNTHIISDSGTIRNCIGCFGCWIKTPGRCVLKDGYDNMGELLSQANSVLIISKCYYGCYSPFIKNILDRSIPYLLPFFRIKNKETHHQKRYKNNLQFSVYFYGENITAQEKETAKNMVKANCVNFGAKHYNVSFLRTLEELRREVTAI